MRNHRIMERVSILLNIKIFLYFAPGVGKEGPLRPHRIAELIRFQNIVRRNRDYFCVRHSNFGVEGRKLKMLLVILGTIVSTREYQDHRIDALEFAQLPSRLRVIGQLLVGEMSTWLNIITHVTVPFN